jgi:hypothetical protein
MDRQTLSIAAERVGRTVRYTLSSEDHGGTSLIVEADQLDPEYGEFIDVFRALVKIKAVALGIA